MPIGTLKVVFVVYVSENRLIGCTIDTPIEYWIRVTLNSAIELLSKMSVRYQVLRSGANVDLLKLLVVKSDVTLLWKLFHNLWQSKNREKCTCHKLVMLRERSNLKKSMFSEQNAFEIHKITKLYNIIALCLSHRTSFWLFLRS